MGHSPRAVLITTSGIYFLQPRVNLYIYTAKKIEIRCYQTRGYDNEGTASTSSSSELGSKTSLASHGTHSVQGWVTHPHCIQQVLVHLTQLLCNNRRFTSEYYSNAVII